MSVFLFRVKGSAFDRAQAKDGQPFVLHVKYDPLLDTCGSGDIAIICTEVNKSAPACFALSACHKDKPLRYSAKIEKYDSSRKDSHKLIFPNNLEQHKNLKNKNIKVYSASGDIIPESVLGSTECEGMDVTVENPQYSFQVETNRCNLLQDGELVIESDTEDTEIYRKIEDDQYVMAIQSLITQKAESATPSSSPPSPSSSPSPAPSATSESSTTTAPDTTQTPQPPSSSTPNMSPPQPPAGSHKPKPAAKNNKQPPAKANGHQGEKREGEASEHASNKKVRMTPNSSPLPSGTEITPVDLLMHVTSVAGMLKELDNEHSERLSKLEEEVARLKAKLATTSLPPSPTIPQASPPTSSGPGRKKKEQHETPTPPLPPPAVTPSPPAFQQKTQKPADPLHYSPGEFIAVRVDPTSSNDGYWMARVIPGTPKQGLVRVKWFEKYAPLPGWYFMDTREDLVDPLSIFHRNFELIVKPWKNRAGHFIDIYRPSVDLSAFDTAS